MQARCFATRLLQAFSVEVEPGYAPVWKMWPMPKPRDGLWVTLRPV
jgi:hypothetical protein